jgi:hypothetical protein
MLLLFPLELLSALIGSLVLFLLILPFVAVRSFAGAALLSSFGCGRHRGAGLRPVSGAARPSWTGYLFSVDTVTVDPRYTLDNDCECREEAPRLNDFGSLPSCVLGGNRKPGTEYLLELIICVSSTPAKCHKAWRSLCSIHNVEQAQHNP